MPPYITDRDRTRRDVDPRVILGFAAAAMLLMLMAIGFLAYRAFFEEPGVVTARHVEVVDAEGRRRALLGVSPEGTVALDLYDAEGNLRSSAGVLADGRLAVVREAETESTGERKRDICWH